MKRPRPTNLPAQLFHDFGLIAWLENTRVALPLKGVECRFEVTGAVTCVELDQIYHQNTNRPLDCTYTFPLPAGAAVYRCELHVNGRVIRAKVEEKEAACRIYREQKAAGRRTALVETERENLFTLSLGNVQPEDLIVVRFAWFQVLDRAGDGLRLLVPTCPGVRYIPGKPLLRALSGRGTMDDTDQVPDASRITPPRIDALHPDAAYFSIEGRLSSADVESGTASSPSHPIYVRESGGAVTVELSGRAAVPDRDFVLAWREPRARQLSPQGWLWTEGAETYALVQLRAPEGVEVADGFPQDFYFLVDRSGSMNGPKWSRTCEALRAFVSLLGANDRVWITLFESEYRDFAEAPMPAPAVLTDRGFQRMEALGTAGGTELLPAALHVLEQIAKHSLKSRPTVVLITDGQVGNDAEIVRVFKRAPAVRLHTFGIDTAVNDAFLKSLARQQRGGCWLQTPDDDIPGTIAALGDRLRRPVLTDLSVQGSWEAGREMCADLHAHEVVTVALHGQKAAPLKLSGRLPDGREHCFAVDFDSAGSEAVKLLWAKERIDALLTSGRSQEAIALARQHNLICEGAAFIAWDESEQVAVAQQEVVQPALESRDARYSMAPCCAPVCRRVDPLLPGSLMESDDLELWAFADGPDHLAEIVPLLVVQLRLVLTRARFPESTVESLLVWAQGSDGDAPDRFRELRKAAELIIELRRALNAPILGEVVDHIIQPALSGSAEALLQWAVVSRQPVARIIASRALLTLGQTPQELCDHLTSWVLESGSFDRERLDKIEAFSGALVSLPFAAASRARHWRAFLDSTLSVDSTAYAVVLQWLPELAHAFGRPSVSTPRLIIPSMIEPNGPPMSNPTR